MIQSGNLDKKYYSEPLIESHNAMYIDTTEYTEEQRHAVTQDREQRQLLFASRSNLFAASIFLLLAIATWISEIELTRYLLEAKGQGGYNNPYAMMWMAHNLYIPLGFGMSFILRSFSSETKRASPSRPAPGSRWETLVSAAPSSERHAPRLMRRGTGFKHRHGPALHRLRL